MKRLSAANTSTQSSSLKLKIFQTTIQFSNPPSAWLIMVGNQVTQRAP
ncbi:MAG: hypothetical protein P8103_04260 [Candidatus Thiodiazotropha sp.]